MGIIKTRIGPLASPAVVILYSARCERQRFVGAIRYVDVMRPGVRREEGKSMGEAPLGAKLQRLVIRLRIAPEPSDRAPQRIGTPRLHRSRRRRSVIQVAAVIQVRGLAADIGDFDRGR